MAQVESEPAVYDIQRLQSELTHPGRTLVFIDDSGTPEQPLGEDLVRDFKLHAAVVLSSDAYRDFLGKHREFLLRYPWADEFHTVDVFQGKRGTWGAQNEETRRRAFNTMAGHFEQFVKKALYVYVGVDQYKEIMERARDAGTLHPHNVNWDSHSEGARIVLLKSIVARVGIDSNAWPLVVVEDAEGGRENCREVMFGPQENVFSDAVFRVDSKAVPGLQLADLLAYCLNRLHHVRAKIRTNQLPRELDPSVMRFLSKNIGRCRDALSDSVSDHERRRSRNQKKVTVRRSEPRGGFAP